MNVSHVGNEPKGSKKKEVTEVLRSRVYELIVKERKRGLQLQGYMTSEVPVRDKKIDCILLRIRSPTLWKMKMIGLL